MNLDEMFHMDTLVERKEEGAAWLKVQKLENSGKYCLVGDQEMRL